MVTFAWQGQPLGACGAAFVWQAQHFDCFSSSHFAQLTKFISHNCITHLTQLHSTQFISCTLFHATQVNQLISHNSSQATLLTQIIPFNSFNSPHHLTPFPLNQPHSTPTQLISFQLVFFTSSNSTQFTHLASIHSHLAVLKIKLNMWVYPVLHLLCFGIGIWFWNCNV